MEYLKNAKAAKRKYEEEEKKAYKKFFEQDEAKDQAHVPIEEVEYKWETMNHV